MRAWSFGSTSETGRGPYINATPIIPSLGAAQQSSACRFACSEAYSICAYWQRPLYNALGESGPRLGKPCMIPGRLEQRQSLESEPLELVSRRPSASNERGKGRRSACESAAAITSPSRSARSAASSRSSAPSSGVSSTRARSTTTCTSGCSLRRRPAGATNAPPCGRAASARGDRRRRGAPRLRAAGRDRAARARPRSGPPARGGSRRSRRARPGPRRARRASRRSAHAARPGSLRERVVGGVADQQVAEAEAVLAGELRPVGADQLAADKRSERGRDLRLSGASAWTAPRWKISPSTEPRSSTRRSAGSSWSSRAASSALSVGGTSTSPSPRRPSRASRR